MADGPTIDDGRTHPSLVTFGETLGRLTAQRLGPLRYSSTLHLGFGGTESNVAIGATRLGTTTAWMGRVGDDEIGRLILTTLRGEGVDVSRASIDPDVPTALMFKELRTQKHRRISYYRRDCAGSRLSPEHLDGATISAAQMLHISTITVGLSESARRSVEAALEMAQNAGCAVSADLNYRSSIWSGVDEARTAFIEVARRSDVVQASLSEAVLTTGEEDPHVAAKKIASWGVKECIVRLGARGAVAVIEGESHVVDAVEVEELDPVGAGDAFAAGYLSAWLEGLAPPARLERAALVGAFAVTVDGDWEGLPTLEELALLGPSDGVTR